MNRKCGLVLLSLLIFFLVFSKQATAKPKRIVSMNLCSDEILLRLADKKNIASVTSSASEPLISSVVELADGIKTNRGSAEEILLFDPDLVIGGGYYTRQTVNILRKLGIKVKETRSPKNFDEIKEYIRDIAMAIEEEQNGEELIRDMEIRLERLQRQRPDPISAVFYWPGGRTAGTNSIIHSVLEAAGIRNVASEFLKENDQFLDLENLVLGNPDMIIVSDYRRDTQTIKREFLSHPIVKKSFPDMKTAVLPIQLILCGSPANVEAVEILSKHIKEHYSSLINHD